MLAPTSVEGFQLFQIQTSTSVENSPGYAAFVRGERTFSVAYSAGTGRSGETVTDFIEKVSSFFILKFFFRICILILETAK